MAEDREHAGEQRFDASIGHHAVLSDQVLDDRLGGGQSDRFHQDLQVSRAGRAARRTPTSRTATSAAWRPARSRSRWPRRSPARAGARCRHRRQELELLDHLEVLVADRVRIAGHEVAVVRVAIAGVDGGVAAGRRPWRGTAAARSSSRGSTSASPWCRTPRTRTDSRGPDDRTARLEHAAGAVLEHDTSPRSSPRSRPCPSGRPAGRAS